MDMMYHAMWSTEADTTLFSTPCLSSDGNFIGLFMIRNEKQSKRRILLFDLETNSCKFVNTPWSNYEFASCGVDVIFKHLVAIEAAYAESLIPHDTPPKTNPSKRGAPVMESVTNKAHDVVVNKEKNASEMLKLARKEKLDSDTAHNSETKRQKTKRRQRTGGHIDGVSNVLLLEGTARAKMFLFPVHN